MKLSKKPIGVPEQTKFIASAWKFVRENEKYERARDTTADVRIITEEKDLEDLEKRLLSFLKKEGWDFRGSNVSLNIVLESEEHKERKVFLTASLKSSEEESE